MPRATLTVHQGSLRGRVVGTLHHNGMNGLWGPKQGEVFTLNGMSWVVIVGVSIWDEGSGDTAFGTLIVERADEPE